LLLQNRGSEWLYGKVSNRNMQHCHRTGRVSLSPSESSEDEAVADAVNGFIMASQGHGISERMHVRVCAFAFQSDLQ
jgi:hypothetical protein